MGIACFRKWKENEMIKEKKFDYKKWGITFEVINKEVA